MTTPTTPPTLDPAAVRPSVEDVAILLRTRTVGMTSGLGGDTGPGDSTTFDDTTRPTGTEAGEVIDTASDETLGQLPASVDVGFYPAIKRAIASRAAYLIEVSFFRDTTRDDLAAAYLGDLRALQLVIPGYVAIAYGLSDRERALLADGSWPPDGA
jgi:hypothetical protein